MEKNPQKNYSLMSFPLKGIPAQLAALAVLSLTTMAAIAAQPVASVSFVATIERIATPQGVILPPEIAKGERVVGSIDFIEGIKREIGTGNGFYWINVSGENSDQTATVQLNAPLRSKIHSAYFAVHRPPVEKVTINCGASACEYDGGIATGDGGHFWKIDGFSLQAPGASGDALSQRQTVARVVEIANAKQARILVTYKEKPHEGDTIRVILSVNSMALQ